MTDQMDMSRDELYARIWEIQSTQLAAALPHSEAITSGRTEAGLPLRISPLIPYTCFSLSPRSMDIRLRRAWL